MTIGLSARALENCENVSLELWEESTEHVLAMRGRGQTRQTGIVKSSSSSSLLKILGTVALVSQHFTRVSAEGMCHDVNGVKEKFDLLGLISAFGIPASTKSLSYSALNDASLYFTGHIGPGTLSVAASLLHVTRSRLASLIAFGGGANVYDLVQLDCPERMHYIGLKSNTECPVANSVGASIVREYYSHWEERQREERSLLTGRDEDTEVKGERPLGRRVGREAKREVKVNILQVGTNTQDEEMSGELRVSLKTSKAGSFLLGLIPLLLTLGVIASSIICNELIVARLITMGTLGMMIAVLGLRLCTFKFSKPLVAKGAPSGDCLIVDETDADTFHVVLGEEEIIQTLFQRKIDFHHSSGKNLLFLAGTVLYVYVIASVLCMPNVSLRGQVHFAIANLIGLAADLVKASLNGKLGLAKKAREQFKIVVRDMVVFGNRTAAIAFVAKHAKNRSLLKSKKLLPCEGSVWQQWWETLSESEDSDSELKHLIATTTAETKDQALLQVLLQDMADGLNA